MRSLWLLCLLAGAVGVASGARILAVLAMPSRSHGILMERLVRQLAGRGHQITYITGSSQMKESTDNVKVIYVDGIQEILMPGGKAAADKMKPEKPEFNMLSLKGMTSWFMFFFTLSGAKMSDYILQQEEVRAVIESKQEFDLILGEAFLDESLLAGFSHRFKAPLVGLMAFMPNIWGNYLTGNPRPTSYIPDPNLGYSTKMSFWERLHSFVYTSAWEIFHPIVYLNWQDAVMRKHFGEETPPIQDILRNTSLLLVNHHYALGFPRPYLPNMVEIAGMHINPVKPLPADLKKFLDESTDGAILFSMGSNLRSVDLTEEIREGILKAFSRVPYRVLWKFEAQLANLPNNVKISKWLPQSDILAHPNVKLFITHGGLLSTTEAVDRGVPVLGIPIFGDQPLNMKHTENAGLGRTIDLNNINQDTFYNAIMEVAANPRYSEAAKLKSSLFKDNIVAPLDKAIWWVEHVIRHKGASHLRSAAQDLPFYQLHQLDVITVLAISAFTSLYISLVISRYVLRKLFSKKQPAKISKRKKQK